jgi:hypothetical protein
MYIDLYVHRQLNNFDGIEVCNDEDYTYYNALISGRVVMYKQLSYNPTSKRLYFLTDKLAQLLGFWDAYHMKRELNLKSGRRFLSVEVLKKKIESR